MIEEKPTPQELQDAFEKCKDELQAARQRHNEVTTQFARARSQRLSWGGTAKEFDKAYLEPQEQKLKEAQQRVLELTKQFIAAQTALTACYREFTLATHQMVAELQSNSLGCSETQRATASPIPTN